MSTHVSAHGDCHCCKVVCPEPTPDVDKQTVTVEACPATAAAIVPFDFLALMSETQECYRYETVLGETTYDWDEQQDQTFMSTDYKEFVWSASGTAGLTWNYDGWAAEGTCAAKTVANSGSTTLTEETWSVNFWDPPCTGIFHWKTQEQTWTMTNGSPDWDDDYVQDDWDVDYDGDSCPTGTTVVSPQFTDSDTVSNAGGAPPLPQTWENSTFSPPTFNKGSLVGRTIDDTAGVFTATEEWDNVTYEWTFSDRITEADGITAFEGFDETTGTWTGSTISATVAGPVVTYSQGAGGDLTGCPEEVEGEYMRIRWEVPSTHAGDWFEIEITVDTRDATTEAVESTATETVEWTGPGTGAQSDPSWLTDYIQIDPPAEGKEKIITRVRYRCFAKGFWQVSSL